MLRFLPPAGYPLKVREIIRALRRPSMTDGHAGLQAIAQQSGVRYAYGASSGRAALAALLSALHELRPDRDVVALPAYTCFTVAASVVRAGLKVFPVEIDPATLDFDFGALSSVAANRLLSIVTSNLFGLVNDVPRAKKIATSKNAFLIDDAAQALGARRFGRPAGTLGDAGLYSLGRGKALAAIEGGIIVTDSDEIAEAVAAEIAKLPEPAAAHNAALAAQMFAYSTLLNPRLYWLPNSLPFLRLGATEFDPAFHAAQLAHLPKSLLADSLGRLETINAKRRILAKNLTAALRNCRDFHTIPPAPDSEPSFIRFPLVAGSDGKRESALERLRHAGIGATAFYPSAICDIEGIGPHLAPGSQHCPKAESLSRVLLTLPTHAFVRPSDVQRMVSILEVA